MKRPSLLALWASGALFLAYFANVSLGALGQKTLLGDVQEMLMLFAASLLFVVSVLLFEAEDAGKRADTTNET